MSKAIVNDTFKKSYVWKRHNTILYTISKDFEYHKTVAIIIFYPTIVNEKFHINRKTMNMLKDISSKKGSIIILDDISKIKKTAKFNTKEGHIEFIKLKIVGIINKLNIPVMVLFSTVENCFSFPYTNLLKIVKVWYIRKKKEIDFSKSIVIGNLGGRYVKELKDGNKVKHIYDSSMDRAFALNNQLAYMLLDDYYIPYSIDWRWGAISKEDKNKEIMESKKKIEPNILDMLKYNIDNNKHIIIIIMGIPSSGKSVLSRRIKDQFYNYKETELVIIDENNFNNEVEFLNELDNMSKIKKHICIVGKLPNKKVRYKIYKTFQNIDKINDGISIDNKITKEDCSSNCNNIRFLLVEMDIKIHISRWLRHTQLELSKDTDLTYNNNLYIEYNNYYNNPINDFQKEDMITKKEDMIIKKEDNITKKKDNIIKKEDNIIKKEDNIIKKKDDDLYNDIYDNDINDNDINDNGDSVDNNDDNVEYKKYIKYVKYVKYIKYPIILRQRKELFLIYPDPNTNTNCE